MIHQTHKIIDTTRKFKVKLFTIFRWLYYPCNRQINCLWRRERQSPQ